jgi:thiosulfate dehydrogenase (quinone) large subunit
MAQRSRFESIALVMLRTLIGWHFLYEGYYKLLLPGWSRSGTPVPAWTAAGYLKAASGPFAGAFQTLAASSMTHWIDAMVPIGLLLVGASLLLGLLTRLGVWGALAFLTLFYLSAIPTDGVPRPGNEGTYLIVSKNLVEWAAVLVLMACHTERLAGLDLLLRMRRAPQPGPRSAGHAIDPATL